MKNKYSETGNTVRYLTRAEELECGARIQNMTRLRGAEKTPNCFASIEKDGLEAVNLLAKKNERLAINEAIKYSRRFKTNVDIEDTIQDGMLGLMNAVKKYDPTRGLKFSTMATRWIYQNISRTANYTSRTIRLPEHRAIELHAINTMVENLNTDLVSENVICKKVQEEFGLSPNEYLDLIRPTLPNISLDAPVTDSESEDLVSILAHTPSAEISAERNNAVKDLMSSISTLSITEKAVLRSKMRDEGSMRVGDITRKYGLTSSQQASMYKNVIRKLRKKMAANDYTFEDFQ